MKKIILILLTFLSLNIRSQQVNDSTSQQVKRNVGVVLGTEAALYAGSMSGLYFLWYAGYDQSAFHFYNDNAEWLQMDKFGHAMSSYYVGTLGYEALRLAGCDEKRSILYGGPVGFVFLTTVEIFDGLSSGWGFSWGDIAANAIGTGLFMTQQALWHEQRISMKYFVPDMIFASRLFSLKRKQWIALIRMEMQIIFYLLKLILDE